MENQLRGRVLENLQEGRERRRPEGEEEKDREKEREPCSLGYDLLPDEPPLVACIEPVCDNSTRDTYC